jgi:hypothetical protein
MSQLPLQRAQQYFPVRAPSDIVQWRDLKGNVIGWFSSNGQYHYQGDGTGVLPTHDAVTIISTGPFVGSSASSPNLLLLFNQGGNLIGFINSFGIPGGSLSTLMNGPIGWIDPQGIPSGSGPIGF